MLVVLCYFHNKYCKRGGSIGGSILTDLPLSWVYKAYKCQVNFYVNENEITADHEESGDYYLDTDSLIVVKQSNIFFHAACECLRQISKAVWMSYAWAVLVFSPHWL